ncbi:hypothetical protein TNCV_4427501 [Trichonephila clavipes]|nr:hypothetical protein TNCV_4427501 [Trichonephila clavipes]
MNTSVCDTKGYTAAYLQFGRQMRASDDIRHDIRQNYHEPEVGRDAGPVASLRKRGRPNKLLPGSKPRHQRNQK